MDKIMEEEIYEKQQVCYGPVPQGWYVAGITPWSLCPGGYQMEIIRLGADIIHCSSTHTVPPGYAIIQLVPNWFHYDGLQFDKFICQKLGKKEMTICACVAIPAGYVLLREIQWSPCTGAHYCTEGKAYVIRKL